MARKHQNDQIVFLLKFFFLEWASSILPQPLTLVYARNSSILYWVTLSLFQNFEVSQAPVATHLKLQFPIWDAIFFLCTYACALKDHLAMTQNCYSRLLKRSLSNDSKLLLKTTQNCYSRSVNH